jgi:hypothetical protein
MGSEAGRAFGCLLGAVGLLVALACVLADAHARPAPVSSVIHDPPAASAQVRHRLCWPQLQSLAGARLRDTRASKLLAPSLTRVLGGRYPVFKASMLDEKALRLEGAGLVGEGVVPNTLGYRGAFFIFGRHGSVFAVIKGGRHETVVQQFGSREVLRDPGLLHAYQEFVGIDE